MTPALQGHTVFVHRVSPMDLGSVLGNSDLYAVLRQYLWAEQEIQLSSLDQLCFRCLTTDRYDILSGIALWLRLEAEREYDVHITRQLHRIWDREEADRWYDSDGSEYDI